MFFRSMILGEEEIWANHCASVFKGPGDSPELFLRHYRNDPYREPAGVLIAEEDGKIVSSVHVFRREMYVMGQRVKLGGIGDVATLPEYRRIGLSGKLLTMAVDYMNGRDLPVSLLFTGVNSHYARYGWFTHTTRKIRLALNEGPGLSEGETVSPLTDEYFDAAAGLYALTASRFNGPMVREHPAYDVWIRRERKNPLALLKDGSLLGYIAYDLREDGALSLTEYGTLPGRECFMELLSAARKIEGTIPVAYIPSAFLPDGNGPFAENTGAMLRLNAPFSLRDRTIDTPGKLASAMEDMVFFSADGF